MLRLTLTLVRRGNELDTVNLGSVEVENVGGDEDVGEYQSRMRGTLLRDSAFSHRRRLGYWPLALIALARLLGDGPPVER